jgi:uncharacterized protein (TIGR02118 family)
MLKVTVIYAHPDNSDEFEHYYKNTHLAIAAKMPFVERMEITKFVNGPDGSKPAHYRMAEIYFADEDKMKASLASPESQTTAADLANFATGGVTMSIGRVES